MSNSILTSSSSGDSAIKCLLHSTGGGGGGGSLPRFWVGMCPSRTKKQKSIAITQAKFFIEKHQKPIKFIDFLGFKQ